MVKEESLLVCKYVTALGYLSEAHQQQVLKTLERGHQIRSALWKIHNTYGVGITNRPTKEQLNAILEEFHVTQDEFIFYLEKSRRHWQRAGKNKLSIVSKGKGKTE
jgi:hypothetical protein